MKLLLMVINKNKYKEIQNNLVDYMNLKRINKELDELNEMKDSKKMIIIYTFFLYFGKSS